jgi:hypothetical protein
MNACSTHVKLEIRIKIYSLIKQHVVTLQVLALGTVRHKDKR